MYYSSKLGGHKNSSSLIQVESDVGWLDNTTRKCWTLYFVVDIVQSSKIVSIVSFYAGGKGNERRQEDVGHLFLPDGVMGGEFKQEVNA